jgi:hypothetical protein
LIFGAGRLRSDFVPRLVAFVPLPFLLAFTAWGSARAADAGGSALGAALSAIAGVVGSEQQPVDDESEEDFQVPGATLAVENALFGLSSPSQKKSKGVRTVPKTPTLFVSADTVLRLSERRATPRGIRVPADGARPAGLRLVGVAGLGVGLRDGDVLTKALGQPALSSSAVVRAILVARANRVKVLDGEFYRGRERWILRVEQPYLDEPGAALTGKGPGPRLPEP